MTDQTDETRHHVTAGELIAELRHFDPTSRVMFHTPGHELRFRAVRGGHLQALTVKGEGGRVLTHQPILELVDPVIPVVVHQTIIHNNSQPHGRRFKAFNSGRGDTTGNRRDGARHRRG